MAYNLVAPFTIIVAGDMSADITSAPLETKLQDNIGLQLNWSGAPVGTFSVQASVDFRKDNQGNIADPGHWIDVPLTKVVTAAGTPDEAIIHLYQLSTPWLRLVYAATSGTGVLACYATAKGV